MHDLVGFLLSCLFFGFSRDSVGDSPFFSQSFNLHTTNNISDVCSNRTHWGNRFFCILLWWNLYPLISFHQSCDHPIKDGHRVSSSFHQKIWSQITWYECCPPVLMMSFQAWDHPLEFEGGDLCRTSSLFKQDHGGFHAVGDQPKFHKNICARIVADHRNLSHHDSASICSSHMLWPFAADGLNVSWCVRELISDVTSVSSAWKYRQPYVERYPCRWHWTVWGKDPLFGTPYLLVLRTRTLYWWKASEELELD